MISIPVAASSARMLRPSRPIILPLYLVVVDVEHSHGILHRRLRSHPLDGLDYDSLGFLGGSQLGVVHYVVDIAGSSCRGFIFKGFHQFSLASSTERPETLFQPSLEPGGEAALLVLHGC